MTHRIFETRMEVRDYECDIEGIVNNANYLHYMEHTRHLFLKECGLSFAEMHAKGVDAVVARMNLQYKSLAYISPRRVSVMCFTRISSVLPMKSFLFVQKLNWFV